MATLDLFPCQLPARTLLEAEDVLAASRDETQGIDEEGIEEKTVWPSV